MSSTDNVQQQQQQQIQDVESLTNQFDEDAFASLVDPALLGLANSIPIDPALFALEQTIIDIRNGKIKVDQQEEVIYDRSHVNNTLNSASHTSTIGVGFNNDNTLNQHQHQHQNQHQHDLLDVEFDPAIREIVNSLTNAQQSANASGPNLTASQAAAAIGAHLSEEDQHALSLRTLEDFTREGFGNLLSESFQHENDNFLLPATDESSTSTHAQSSLYPEAGPSHIAHGSVSDLHDHHSKRRGRPKGSKNKPKPDAPPPPPPPAPKPRGRPPKARDAAELAEYEKRRFEKAQGLSRSRGRPRKFPGYLVREMRLKKHKAEYRELLNAYERDSKSTIEDNGINDTEQGKMNLTDLGVYGIETGGVEGHVNGDEEYDWPVEVDEETMEVDEQTLLAAVRSNLNEQERQSKSGKTSRTGDGVDGADAEMPSARAFKQGEEIEMGRVFGLVSD